MVMPQEKLKCLSVFTLAPKAVMGGKECGVFSQGHWQWKIRILNLWLWMDTKVSIYLLKRGIEQSFW